MVNASIDMTAASDLGIHVCGTGPGGGPSAGTPELTWALLLSLARYLPQEAANVKSNGWQTTVGHDLVGSTIGIIGLGRIGTTIARYAKAFDMNVIAWSQNLTPEAAQAAGAKKADSLIDLMTQANL